MKTILWEVDAQVDFMLPGGKLYASGAEKIIPNLNRLVETARQGKVLLVSSADAHKLDDPEFLEWPAHCVKGTAGAELIPEARAAQPLIIPNQENFVFPGQLNPYRQILLEKNSLDVFDNPNTDALLARLNVSQDSGAGTPPEFLVFGVVTEYCVRCAATGLLRRGHRISIVKDAIQSLDENKGQEILNQLQAQGARLITTDQALELINRNADAEGKLQNVARA